MQPDPALSAAKELTPSQANAPKTIQYAVEQRAATIRRHYQPTLDELRKHQAESLKLCDQVREILNYKEYWRPTPIFKLYLELDKQEKILRQILSWQTPTV